MSHQPSAISHQPRGVIFDMDGVLVNTEPLHFAATRDALAEIGIPLTEAEYYSRYLAYPDPEMFAMLVPDPRARPAVMAAKGRRYLELAAAGIPAFPDGLGLLARLQGWRIGLATGSLAAEAELALGALGIRDRFQVVISQQDCVRGKPDPEPFLRAADGLGLSPARCLVVEDAPGGIQAAKGAGMRCLAVTHSCPRERLRGADWIVDDLGTVDLDLVAASLGAAGA
jgi:HAD superfamily hydrolase (TIGR01509 family)